MIAICLLTTMSFSTLVGCDIKGSNAVQESKIKKATYKDFTYDVNPETFTLTVEHDGVKEQASQPLPKMKVSNVKRKGSNILGISRSKSKGECREEKDYLNIEVESTGAESFTWPKVQAENYTLPLWEGSKFRVMMRIGRSF